MGEELCYKFIGDKAYNKLFHISHLAKSNIKDKKKKVEPVQNEDNN